MGTALIKPACQIAALSELRSGRHEWRYLLSGAANGCYVCGRRRKRGEGYWRVNLHAERIIKAFEKYMEHAGHPVTRAVFEQNFAAKRGDPEFMGDIGPLLAAGYEWNPEAGAEAVSAKLIARLPGEPWKGNVRRRSGQ